MPTTRSPRPLIELSHLSKTFDSGGVVSRALHDVSLTLNSGEVTAIVGPSGSGKTTLTHIIGGLVRPSEGHVKIDGTLVKVTSDSQVSYLRNHLIGFVLQNYGLLAHYTTTENVALPLMIAGIGSGERRQRAHRTLRSLGMMEYADRRVTKLSGGQRQRIAIARALVTDPPIIIADEPTGNLDNERADSIMDIFQGLAANNKAVLIVTHDRQLASRADRTIVLNEGEIAQDTHA